MPETLVMPTTPEPNAAAPMADAGEMHAAAEMPAQAQPTPQYAEVPTRSEREKHWKELHKSSLRDFVAVRDEDGKIKMVQGEDGEWRFKTRLNLNAYAKHHKGAEDTYAALARDAGYGKTVGTRVRDAFVAAREKLQRSDTAEAEEKKDTNDWKTRTKAMIGGLAVGAVAGAKLLTDRTRKQTNVARTSVRERIKHMHDAPVVADETDKRSRRNMVIAGVAGGLLLLGALGFAAHEADENRGAGSQDTSTSEGASTGAAEAEQGTAGDPAQKYPEVDVSKQIYPGAIPGETINGDDDVASSVSEEERTLSLPLDGNIWNSSRAFLEQHGVTPSDYNTDLLKDAVLAAEGLSEPDDTLLLPVGYTFTIPEDVLARLK